MSAADRPEPVRSCIGCRQRRPQSALVRVTRSPSAGIVVGGPSEGRGAWLCRIDAETVGVDPRCLDTALARRAFARAWRTELDEHDHHAIRTGLTGGDDQADVL